MTHSELLNVQLEKELLKLIEHLRGQQNRWEERQKKLVEEHYPTTLNALKSIPGIGPKTAMMLIIATDNFKEFSNYRQLVAYVGFSPHIRQSGSSVRGRGATCKMGNALLRKLLYMWLENVIRPVKHWQSGWKQKVNHPGSSRWLLPISY